MHRLPAHLRAVGVSLRLSQGHEPWSEAWKEPVVGPEWIIVVVVAVVVIFGVNKLPQIARNMGKAQSEFKKGLKEGGKDEDAAQNTPPPPPPPAE